MLADDLRMELMDLGNKVLFQMHMKNLTLATAESATGGFLSNIITNIDGSSKVFIGGAICYSANSKNNLLDVDYDLINDFGTVSPEVTEALLEGLKEKVGADIGIAITGIAGSYGIEGKPRGLMYIGIGSQTCNKVREFKMEGSRIEIKAKISLKALELLLEELDNM